MNQKKVVRPVENVGCRFTEPSILLGQHTKLLSTTLKDVGKAFDSLTRNLMILSGEQATWKAKDDLETNVPLTGLTIRKAIPRTISKSFQFRRIQETLKIGSGTPVKNVRSNKNYTK